VNQPPFISSPAVSEPRPQPQQTPGGEVRREIVEFVKVVVWFLVLFFMLRFFVIEGYEVQGPSMEPTLLNGERILVSKLPLILSKFRIFDAIDPIQEGDIVVLNGPDGSNKRYVKRVVARGPERERSNTVDASGHSMNEFEDGVLLNISDGELYVNSQRVHEDYLSEDRRIIATSPIEELLGPGTFFVLGDNRPVSKDSRNFHAIDEEDIIGKAVLRFWPLKRFNLLR
jgi:signal peptidase I